MNYDPDHEAGVGHRLGLTVAAAFGAAAGFIATLAVFGLAATLRAAYPPWAFGIPAIGEIIVPAAFIIYAARAPVRSARSSAGARALSAGFVLALTILVTGELVGVTHLAGAHSPMYLTPWPPAPLPSHAVSPA